MVSSTMSISYSQLFDQVQSFYSIKQFDSAFQKLLYCISSSNTSCEESIPFNDDHEIIWVPNQKIQEFIQKINGIKPVILSSKELLKKGSHTFLVHVISQLLITKLRFHLYNNDNKDFLIGHSKLENDINIFGSRIIQTLESLKEVEERIKHYLKSNPIISEFESVYQKVVKAQQAGNQSHAKAYAEELSTRKSKYILATKVIQNDLVVLNQYYANIQMIHKSIISAEKMMMDQKEYFLSDRIKSLNKSYSQEEETLKRSQVLEVLNSQIKLVGEELSNMNLRSEVIVIKEKHIDQTLSQIQSQSNYNPLLHSDSDHPNPDNTWIKIKTTK